jgi:hypothetical protein
MLAFGCLGAQSERCNAWEVDVALDVRHALAYYLAVSERWLLNCRADHLTVGIRDAYYHGLAVAVPTGPRELGYAMDSET